MKRKGFTVVELAIYAVIIAATVVMVSSVGTTSKTMSANTLKAQVTIVDNALSVWYKSHHQTYPNDLTTIQNMGIIPWNMDLTSFTYTVQGGNTQYRLTVVLPIGGVYVSPGSKY